MGHRNGTISSCDSKFLGFIKSETIILNFIYALILKKYQCHVMLSLTILKYVVKYRTEMEE